MSYRIIYNLRVPHIEEPTVIVTIKEFPCGDGMAKLVYERQEKNGHYRTVRRTQMKCNEGISLDQALDLLENKPRYRSKLL
jgi:hypothetical protein